MSSQDSEFSVTLTLPGLSSLNRSKHNKTKKSMTQKQTNKQNKQTKTFFYPVGNLGLKSENWCQWH